MQRHGKPLILNSVIKLLHSGEYEDLKKNISSKRKSLKFSGKGNRPNSRVPLDEEQVERLFSSGAIGKYGVVD